MFDVTTVTYAWFVELLSFILESIEGSCGSCPFRDDRRTLTVCVLYVRVAVQSF